MSHLGMNETFDFMFVIKEFCGYLFIFMVMWFLILEIVHHKRVFSLKYCLKSFYKGLSGIGDKEFFSEYAENHFNRKKSWKGSGFRVLFMRLLIIFRNYQTNKNRPQYLVEVNQLHSSVRDTFAHNNTQTLSIQLTAAFFILIVFLYELIFATGYVFLLPIGIVGIFILLSIWLYLSREKQGDRASAEIDRLESTYAKYLTS
jgi:hypothetical protein